VTPDKWQEWARNRKAAPEPSAKVNVIPLSSEPQLSTTERLLASNLDAVRRRREMQDQEDEDFILMAAA
jgi:hypothetical protein